VDQQQNPINQTIVSEEEMTPITTTPSKPSHDIVLYALIGVVVAAVVAMVFMMAGQFTTLVTDVQKTMFPVMSAILIGALAGIWLYNQTAGRLNSKEPKAWVMPVLGGALTLCIAVSAYVCIGMWPAGEKSAMIVDLHHQYGPMISQLRHMMLNGGDMFYSFDIGTGTGFIPLFAYYLASPLNILLAFFPQAYLAEGILFITLIKMALTGALMTLCLQYIFKLRSALTIVVGIMYAFMMYMLSYSWDIMWLDCVMMLPLIIMGFERMMREGKYLMYIFSLAYALFSNYYIGFMLCIFLVLYYCVFFFRAKRHFRAQMIGFARFAIGSALGGGLAMCILLPAFLSLSSTSAAGGQMPAFATNFNVFELIGRGLYGVEPTIRSGNLPNTYCGVLAVLTLPIFATMKSISLRRRFAYLGLFAVMAISLVINQIDLLWHGMHSPNDLPYRYSFLYSFALLLIAFEVLYRIRDIRPVQIAASIFGIAVYLIVEENFGSGEYSYLSLYLSFALILVYGAVMFLVAQKKFAVRSASLLLLTVVAAEMLFNASLTFGQMNNNEHYTNHKDYLDNITTDAVQATVDRMEEIHVSTDGTNFYRMEFLPRRTTADTALFDYHGITNFASSASYNMTRFMGSMGYDVNGVNSQLYKSFVPTADSLMGIKYVALETDLTNHPQLRKIDTVHVTKPVENPIEGQAAVEERTYHIYENPYALSLGFMVKDGVKDWNYNYYDPMASQNSLFKTLTGTTDNVMVCQQITSLNPSAGSVNGVSAFSINGAQTAVFTAKVEQAGQVYIHVDCRAAKSINVSAAGNSWGVTTYEPWIIDAGYLEAGTEVTVTISSDNSCAGNVFVASLDSTVFDRDITSLKANSLQITDFSDSRLSGNIYAAENGVMMTTIEYDKGWTVKVDGQEVETFAIGDALLAVDMPAGEHTVEFSYTPTGFVPGVLLTVVSVLLLVFLQDYVRRRDGKKGFLPFFNKTAKGDETA